MKKLLWLLGVSFLSGCSYSDGCFYSPQMVTCVDKGEPYPSIAHYQKKDTIGHTDSEQRWKDVVACGATYGDKSLRSGISKGRSYPIDDNLVAKFRECMTKKGYIRIESGECGYQNPKWDTGKCNL